MTARKVGFMFCMVLLTIASIRPPTELEGWIVGIAASWAAGEFFDAMWRNHGKS